MRTRPWDHLAIRVGVFLGWGVAGACFGHDTWLVPERFSVPPGGGFVALALTSGVAFPTPETSIDPARIAEAKLRLGDHTADLLNFASAATSLRFSTRLTGSGVAVFWVRLKPRILELTPTQIAGYLREIDAPASTREAWEKGAAAPRWKESYTKHAKTFVKVADDPSDHSWSRPVGLDLEIVPESDPTRLQVGDDFGVRVIFHGAPLPDFSLSSIGENNRRDLFQKTGADGRATFHLSQAGRWLIHGTSLRRSALAERDWDSDFTTLTIDVQAR